MKSKILVSVLLCMFQNMLFSQDTAIVKFFPLKTGNIWVYSWTANSGWPANGQVRLKITGTVQSNDHIYYNFEQTGNPCVCAQSTFSPLLIQLNNPFRIDSASGNIFIKSTDCGWHIGEQLLDSLKMVPDTCFISTNCFFVSCYDTNSIVLFGNNIPSKNVGRNIMTYGSSRRYAKGFGLAASHQNGPYGSTCDYSLAGCVLNGIVYGDTTITGINPISQEIPSEFKLHQNYPNPFNPVTKIKFDIPTPLNPPFTKGGTAKPGGFVQLIIYNILGREIAVLVNERLKPGTYKVEWDGSNSPSGVYFYKLITNDFTETKKMVSIK